MIATYSQPAPDYRLGLHLLTLVFFVVLALTSGTLTALVRRYALENAVLDLPNARSSHTIPTPRGGGLAIVATTLLGWTILAFRGGMPGTLAIGLGGGGAVIAAVGWIDDHRSVSSGWRFVAHVCAAAWAMMWIHPPSALRIASAELQLGPARWAVAVLIVVWCTNLYNFMDGIDGLAASEAVTCALFGGLLVSDISHGALSGAAWCLGAGAAGFLYWNWPPARIFMGDVGSGFLGFAFGGLAIASEARAGLPTFDWMLLLGVFVFDATLTLIRRLIAGEKWYSAHRSHAYQRLTQSTSSHRRVTWMIVGLNLCLGLLVAVGHRLPRLELATNAVAVALLAATYWCVERIRPMRVERPRS